MVFCGSISFPLPACNTVGVGRLGYGEIKDINKFLKGTKLPGGIKTRSSATLLTVLCCLLVGDPGTSTTSTTRLPSPFFLPTGHQVGFEAVYIHVTKQKDA